MHKANPEYLRSELLRASLNNISRRGSNQRQLTNPLQSNTASSIFFLRKKTLQELTNKPDQSNDEIHLRNNREVIVLRFIPPLRRLRTGSKPDILPSLRGRQPLRPLELNLISHSLESLLSSPLSQDPHPQLRALTLLFRYRTLLASCLRLHFESLTLNPWQPPSMMAAPRLPHSHDLPLSQDPHPRPRALTLVFQFRTQHQPYIFGWTLSLTLSPSQPPSATPHHPHPPPHAKHLSP